MSSSTVHNYAYYRQQVIGSPETPVAALADLWAGLRHNSRVIRRSVRLDERAEGLAHGNLARCRECSHRANQA